MGLRDILLDIHALEEDMLDFERNPVRAWLAGVEPVDGVVPSDHAALLADLDAG